MQTRSIKQSEVTEKWYLIDAQGVRLGKLATRVASILNGKEDVNNVPYLKSQNKVIVINSKKIDVHPSKLEKKMYHRHSGYVGGLTSQNLQTVMDKRPNRVIETAIKGMLPNTRQRQVMLNNLYVYETGEHKHDAQKPEIISM